MSTSYLKIYFWLIVVLCNFGISKSLPLDREILLDIKGYLKDPTELPTQLGWIPFTVPILRCYMWPQFWWYHWDITLRYLTIRHCIIFFWTVSRGVPYLYIFFYIYNGAEQKLRHYIIFIFSSWSITHSGAWGKLHLRYCSCCARQLHRSAGS